MVFMFSKVRTSPSPFLHCTYVPPRDASAPNQSSRPNEVVMPASRSRATKLMLAYNTDHADPVFDAPSDVATVRILMLGVPRMLGLSELDDE
eukprot:6479258-Amphidinium_carterae.2